MTPDDIPDDKPFRIYLIAGLTFLNGTLGFWLSAPELGHFWGIITKLFSLFLVWLSWALVTLRPGAATLTRDAYLAQSGFALLVSFGVIGYANPALRFGYAFSAIVNVALCFALTRKRFLIWYLPRRRGGYYINERT